MKYVLQLALFATVSSFAQVPEPVITTMTSSSGHATIAGRLNSKPEAPVGISVRNGNLIYSTITDLEGRWGIVIRHQSVNVSVESWNFNNPLERSEELKREIHISPEGNRELNTSKSHLPWTRYVSGNGSSSSETSAKYYTETNLRWEIERERSNCRIDKGSFSSSGGLIYCNKSGSTYHCKTDATCECR